MAIRRLVAAGALLVVGCGYGEVVVLFGEQVGASGSASDLPGPDALADFEQRCAAPGVLVCQGFDSPVRDDGFEGLWAGEGAAVPPRIDETVAASGASSLRLTVAGRTEADGAGGFFSNFSEDQSVAIGEGEEVYVQWRQRFSPAMLDTPFSGHGWKQLVVGPGDRDGELHGWCRQLSVTVTNPWQRNRPELLHSCGAGKDGSEELYNVQGDTDIDLQPGGDAPCWLNGGDEPGCVGYVPDTWMTFQLRVAIGTWYRNDLNYAMDSEVDLWVTLPGQTRRHVVGVHDRDLANEDPTMGYGKVWLLPYNPRKDADVDHATAEVWYDELVVSRLPIADPQ
ncbi:MAG: hypothetical protein AAF721_29530 [Myxococcota bacterium]